MSYRKNSRLNGLGVTMICMLVLSIVIVPVAFQSVKAQQVEKLELILAPPIYLGNPALGYYEARGNVYGKKAVFDCGLRTDSERVGTYRIGVAFGSPREHVATYQITLGERPDVRFLFWQGYYKYDPFEDGSTDFSWPYSGIVLRSTQTILTDFTPLSKSCFGGKLVVYFLNGG